MENYADNVENLIKPSFFSLVFYFAYGKLFQNSCQEFFENIFVSPFCTNMNGFKEQWKE